MEQPSRMFVEVISSQLIDHNHDRFWHSSDHENGVQYWSTTTSLNLYWCNEPMVHTDLCYWRIQVEYNRTGTPDSKVFEH